MLKAMPRQCGVVGFNIDLDFALQTVAAQKSVDCGYIVIVLMLGGFARLGLDQDRAFEANLVLVLHHHVQEATHLIQLLANAGVQQCLVALATAPKHVVFAT